jgi:hypothetical protein
VATVITKARLEENEMRDLEASIEAAVRVLDEQLGPEARRELAASSEGDLVLLHIGLGAWVRNRFELWQDRALVRATGCANADDASMVIVRALWQRLRERDGATTN